MDFTNFIDIEFAGIIDFPYSDDYYDSELVIEDDEREPEINPGYISNLLRKRNRFARQTKGQKVFC